MDKAEIGQKFMEFMEKEFGVTFVDVTPRSGVRRVHRNSMENCERCSHYLTNHSHKGCFSRCGCPVKVTLIDTKE
jgi:hypothetical protein